MPWSTPAAVLRPSLLRPLLLLTLLPALIWACQVPVFRYALERWPAEACRLEVGPGGGAEADAARALLRQAVADPRAPLNLELQEAAGLAPGTLALQAPAAAGETARPPVWQAPLTPATARLLADSPVRRTLRERLLAGESAVWLLLESGDAAKDAAAAGRLAQALEAAQASLQLPEGVLTPEQARQGQSAGKPEDVLQSEVPLRLAFSTLRLSRQDAAEAVLIAQLLRVEDDLADYAGEPMAFPVFGRGRVLEPLIGAGIHRDNVVEHAQYLCGACSCEVKALNPGMDLLLAAAWGPADTLPEPETVRIEPVAVQADGAGRARWGWAGAGALVLLLAVRLLGQRRPA